MPRSATDVIASLRLEPHPEGGAFREVFRSTHLVPGSDGRPRPALTHIYFLLAEGGHSRWHRIPQAELWHSYDGDPLELMWLTPGFGLERQRVGPPSSGHVPSIVVPGGCWQAASSLGNWSLAGCTVAPGFEFEDLELMSEDPAAAAELRRRFPDLGHFLQPSAR